MRQHEPEQSDDDDRLCHELISRRRGRQNLLDADDREEEPLDSFVIFATSRSVTLSDSEALAPVRV